MFGKCFGKNSDSSDEIIQSPPSFIQSKPKEIASSSEKRTRSENIINNSSSFELVRNSSATESNITSYTVKAFANPARAHEISLPVIDVSNKDKESERTTSTRKSLFRRSSAVGVAGIPGLAFSVIVPETPAAKETDKQYVIRKSKVVLNSRNFGTQTVRKKPRNLDRQQPRTSSTDMDIMLCESSSSTISYISDQNVNEMTTEKASSTVARDEILQKDREKRTPSRIGKRQTLSFEEFIEVDDFVPVVALPKPIRDMIDPQDKEISTILEEILYFRQKCLEVHNRYRELHNTSPLTLDMKICNYAQEWANYMAESGSLDQQGGTQFGYNLFKGIGITYTAKMIVKQWYDEITRYNFIKPSLHAATIHFTQIVWASSKLLGVGMRKRNRYTYVVCIYEPAGNTPNMFGENVAPPTNLKLDEALSKAEDHLISVEFAKACLQMHNTYRVRHDSPPLELNEHMNNYATEWAQQLAKYGFLRHRPNNKYGENLLLATNYDPTAEEVVTKWYNECKIYNYEKPSSHENTGNFTQIVWKRTTDLGVGLAKIGKSTYVVCNYAPRGNVLEQYTNNVLKPLSSESVITEQPSSAITLAKEIELEADSRFTTFQEQCLHAHNNYRSIHDCPPLTLSRPLCNYAQEWANHLAIGHTLEHRPNNTYGENLYYTSVSLTGEDPVKTWYNEIRNYNFNNPGFHVSTSHFTQVIWKKSQFLGVGKAVRDHFTFVVCNYEPPGNIPNQFELNVPPIVGHEQETTRSIYSQSVEDVVDIKPVDLGGAFEDQCLKAHNKYRTMHGCPPLQINRVLNVYALDFAKQLCKQSKLTPRVNNLYGENLYFAQGFKPYGWDVVNTWYSEIHDYDFQNPQFSVKTAHFTQLIWKTSRDLGVAAVCADEHTYVVCNYAPPGNIIGHFEHNVPPAFIMRPEVQMQEKKLRESLTRTSMYTNQVDSFVFAEEILRRHNLYRAKHRVPPVELSEKLNDVATEWANILANTDALKNRVPNLYGECLFKATGWNVMPENIMTYWYNESHNYRSDEPKPSNFTQIIWRDTKHIGVGIAKRGNSTWVVVNYEPPGNYPNQYKENVLPALKKAIWM